MKKLQSRWFVLMVVAICLSLQAAAQYSSTQCPTVYEQLVDLNKYWADQEVDFDILEQRICFEKHTDLIQLHLSLVEQHLRQKDVSDLSLGQQLKRKLGLNILRAYWKEGRFPINNHHPGQVVPYFIDDFGTACAVGHIVRETGFEDFAKKVQRENNYAYIEDMDYPELTAWAGEYGFEEEELRWVQPSYGSSVRFEVEYIEPTCGNSDGSIIVSVIGSFTSFDTLENAFFTWYQGDEPAGQPISYAKSLTNVPAGEYTLLVDAPNQNATDPLPAFKTFRLSNADGPSISAMTTAESCENEQDGAITIEVTSGVAPHSIQLFNLGPSYNFEAGSYNRPENFIGYGTSHDGLQGNIWLSSNSPPNYRVEITDANGCITYEEIGLATNRISVGASSWNNGIIFPDCGLGNGSINVSVFDEGLAGGLEYNWNTGDTGPSIQGIEAGEYAVTVVDDWGCQISEEFTISNSDGPTLDFSNVTSTPTSCPGVSDGQIQIDFVDGVPPYSIKWYKNEGGLFAAPVWAFKGEGTAFMPNYVITGLAGDPNNPDGPIAPPVPTYKVVVEDGEGCRSSYELTLQEASVFGLYDVEVFNNTSCSAPNGSIVLSSISCIPNGCAEVRWEDGVVGGTRSNLATGSYGYAIVNACNGDTLVSTSAYVGGENVSIGSVEAGYASCGASNGWAEVILNTNEDLDFNWSHSTTLNSSVAENLAPGDYQVTVTGENGCSVVRSFTIYELPGVIFNDASTQVSNPASPGAADGSIKVEASSGDGTISYSWSHNASLDANQALNLSSGQYFITATSDGGCSDVITLTLSASSCTVTPDDILCRPWVQNYLNTNYPCNDGQCGSINLYTSPTGECVVDFVGEQPCLLAACPSHEVFDLDGNLLESYVSECGLEDLGYTNRQLVWSCGQAVCPEPVDCPNDPGEVLCLDWLSDEIQGLDCETCPYDASSAVTHGIYVADLNGTEGIVVRTQCGFNYLHRRFFDCEGTLLYDCFEEGLTLCSDWNDGIVLGDQLWDCSQPLPDCSTTPSPLPDQAEVIYSDPGLWGVTNAIFFNDEIHYAIGKDPMSNFPGYPNPNSNFGKLTLCNSSGEIHEYESESVASNAIHGDMAINPDGNLACVYQAPTGTGYGFRLPYKEWDGSSIVTDELIFPNANQGAYGRIEYNSAGDRYVSTFAFAGYQLLLHIHDGGWTSYSVTPFSNYLVNLSTLMIGDTLHVMGRYQLAQDDYAIRLYRVTPSGEASFETIDESVERSGTLYQDREGRLRAIYSKDNEVKLATQSAEGQPWEIETVQAVAGAGYRINIIQTAYEDRLFAAYHSTSENQFEVLEKVDGEWTSVYLHEGLSEPGPGRNPSLLERNDTLYAVYYDAEHVYQATLPLIEEEAPPILVNLDNDQVLLRFSQNVNSVTVVLDNIKCWGDLSGYKTGAFEVSGTDVTFTPDVPFVAGEAVHITSTNGITTSDQIPFAASNWIETAPTNNPTNGVFYPENTGIVLPEEATANSFNLLTADVNQDGQNDIIARYHAAYGDPTNILVYMQADDGTFLTPDTYSNSYSHSGIQGTPDLNSDGYPDILLTHNVPSRLHVRLNNGDGTFGEPSFYNIANYAHRAVWGDIDRDGDIDVVASAGNASQSSNRISILKNNGDGTFQPTEYITTGVFGRSIDLADTDNDGDLDMFHTSSTSFGGSPVFRVFSNDGEGAYTQEYNEDNPNVKSISTILDFNGDGNKDILVSSPEAQLFFGNSDLSFSLDSPDIDITSSNGDAVRIYPGDINGDGFPDVLQTAFRTNDNWNQVPYSVYFNNGTGNFTDETGGFDMGSWQSRYLSDMDADGDIDHVYVTEEGEVFIAVNGTPSPWLIPNCNASLNIHFINTVWDDFSSDIDGSPLASSDWVGLFYQDENGQFICSDAVQIADPAENFTLQACGDDPLTTEKDGFVPGEVFRYKVLKDDVEYQPADLYPEYHELGHFSPSQPNALQTFEGNLRASALKELKTQVWPPLPPDCDNATVLNCGDIYTNHTNSAGLRNAEWYNCTDNVLNGPEVVYVFEQPTTQDVRITLSNLQNDLELFLFDECDQFNCIAKSERSGTGDEVILFQDLAPGTYYVVVEGYYGYESTYDIALECGEFPQGDFTCAPEAISCGETIAGSTNGACDEVDFYNCGEAYTSGPEVVYELTVDELTQMTATLNITGGSDLDLFLLDDFDPNACIAFSNQGGETVEQLLLDLYPGRTYYLVVDGFNGAQGGYELTVSCNDYIPCNNPPCPPPPPGVDCEDLPSIACNETIEGNNATGNNRVETWGSCSGIVTGPEVVYRFTNPQDQYVRVELFDFRENLNVYVLDECPTGGCILAGDKSGLIPEAVQSPVLPAGEYVIAVDGFAGAVSDFKLRVTCENAFVECLEIPIVPGENYISSNRVPVDLEMKKIFNGAGDFVEVVIDENSREMMNTSPGADPSNDAKWDVTDGYKVFADGSGTLTICGEEADSTLAIEVVGVDDDGIPFNNYIPYLYQNELIVSQAFSNIEGLGALFYIPPTGTGTPMPYFFQTGGPEDFSMQGGRGYILQVDADGAFSYRNAGAPYVPNGCTYFQTPVRQTFHHSVIKMPRAVAEEWLTPGDEIGFFTIDGVLTGSARYNGYDCLSVLQADQVGSSPKEGFKTGETIQAKIWKKATNTVVEVMPVFQEKPSTFANGLVYRLQELQLLTTATDAGQTALNWTLYPNPAKGKAFVEFALRQTSPVSIEILSIDGRRQLVLPPSAMSQGHHTVELDLDGLPSGAYWIRLITQDGATVRKLVIEKQ